MRPSPPSRTVSGLTAGIRYDAWVKALAGVEGPASNVLSATPQAAGPPTALTLTVQNATVAESVGTVAVTATLNHAAETGGVQVTLSAATGSTATATDDYSLPAAFTINEGNKTATANVTIVDDTDDEQNETIVLRASSTTSGITITGVTITITDNDDPPNQAPTVSMAIADITGLATEATREIDLSNHFSDADNDTLTYTAASGDKTKATAEVSGSTLTVTGVAAGATPVTVTATDTANNEATDTFTVTVQESGDATLSALTLSAGSISPTFSSGTTSYTLSAANSVTATTVTATANHSAATLEAGLSGSLSTLAGGTASNPISLAVGSNTIEVKVTAEDETSRTYTVTVTRAAAAPSTLTLSVQNATVAESAGTVTVTATLDHAAETGGVQVTLTAATQSTATAADDYSLPAAFTINEGGKTATADVTIVDDKVDEDDETIVLSTGAIPSIATTGTTVTIKDNDTAGVAVSPSSLSVAQGATSTYTVRLTSQPVAAVTVWRTISEPDKVSVSPGSRTFSASDWNTNKTFTVTGAATGSSTISHDVTSNDAKYPASLSIRSVGVTVVAQATVPSAPTGLTVVAGNELLQASWTAPSNDGSATITGYAVEYKRTAAASWTRWTHSGTATSATITGLTKAAGAAGVEHQVRVAAINSEGAGANSAVAAGTPYATPGAPGAPLVTPGAGSLAVSWSEPNDYGSAITRYEVQHKLSSAGGWPNTDTDVTGSTSTNITGLTNGSSYDVRVQAVNSAGAGGWSAAQTGTPLAALPTALTLAANPRPAEGGGPVTVTAILNNPAPAGGTTVTLTLSGTATGEGTDYTLSSTTIAIAGGQTRGTTTIRIIDDEVGEDGETIILNASSTNPALTARLILTITDNDANGNDDNDDDDNGDPPGGSGGGGGGGGLPPVPPPVPVLSSDANLNSLTVSRGPARFLSGNYRLCGRGAARRCRRDADADGDPRRRDHHGKRRAGRQRLAQPVHHPPTRLSRHRGGGHCRRPGSDPHLPGDSDSGGADGHAGPGRQPGPGRGWRPRHGNGNTEQPCARGRDHGYTHLIRHCDRRRGRLHSVLYHHRHCRGADAGRGDYHCNRRLG